MRIKTKNMVKYNGEYHPTGTTLTVPDEVGFYLYRQGAAEPAGASEPVQVKMPATSDKEVLPAGQDGDGQNPETGGQETEGNQQATEVGESEPESSDENDPPDLVLDELVIAAQSAVAMGKVIDGGKPTVKAMEEILKRNISAADRDRAWEVIKPPAIPGN